MEQEIEMMEGMEEFIGKKLSPWYVRSHKEDLDSFGYILTRPDHYTSDNIHINMTIRFDKNNDYTITAVHGDKCYSYYRGMYNRSSPVKDRPFSKRDIAYLQRFLRRITE